jgi:hypothetical protein
VDDSSKLLDLFPTSEPEIKGQLAAFAVVLRGLIETLIANGALTKEQAVTLLRETDVKAAFAIWDQLQGEMPDSELKRMEEQGVAVSRKSEARDFRTVKLIFGSKAVI